MYAHMHVSMHTCNIWGACMRHRHIHTYIDMCMCAYICTCRRTYLCLIYVLDLLDRFAYKHICIHIHMCLYIYVFLCVLHVLDFLNHGIVLCSPTNAYLSTYAGVHTYEYVHLFYMYLIFSTVASSDISLHTHMHADVHVFTLIHNRICFHIYINISI